MTPLYLPFGAYTGEVVDPDALAREGIEAARIAASTGPWNWKRSAFADVNVLVRGGPVVREAMGVQASLQTLPGALPVLPDTAGANANLWKVPYNRGFSVIDSDGANGGAMRVTWTSIYPELLWCFYTMQYIRWDTVTTAAWLPFFSVLFNGEGRRVRVQTRMQVDGAPLDGTGPDVVPIDGLYRGQGLAVKAAALAATAFTLVPPGFHTFEVAAAQASAMSSDDDRGERETYADLGPNQGVCVGSRQGFVLRFPMGAGLGA